MKTTVIRIEKGFTHGLRHPIVWAVTACGHGSRVSLRPCVMACTKCGAEQEIELGGKTKPCACGGWSFSYAFRPDEHNPNHWVTKAGDEVECEECSRFDEALARLRALPPRAVFRARFRTYDSRGIGPGAYYLYRRDEASPSGVSLLMSIDARPEVELALADLRISPLSPTERA